MPNDDDDDSTLHLIVSI